MTASSSPTPTIVELRAGELRLALRPDLGGSIAGLWLGDTAVLRSTEPAALERPRLSGCYPLVPYSNRIGHRRFNWRGKAYTTAPNFDDNPHSVHGVGWLRPWEVLAQDEANALLRYRHAPDEHWPFPFDATQRFEVSDGAMRVEMSVLNRADEPVPVGIGWHPYFPKRARSRIHLDLAARWDSDSLELPTRRVAQPGIDGDVATLAFDNCFDDWRGPARIRDELMQVKLTSSLNRAVVFTPQEKPYYCVEPVSHVSNAIHMSEPTEHGLVALAPGETLTGWMAIAVTRT